MKNKKTILILIITFFIININVFAYQETTEDKEYVTFKIYDSLDQYEEENPYEIVPYSLGKISTLEPVFIRLNDGTDSANILEVKNFIVKDSNFLNQKILAEIPHAFIKEYANTLVYFKIG